ncbi:MAG: aspartate 1-decarboxylase, partial [Pseudomonadota bacterium]
MDFGLGRARKLDLGLFRNFLQTLQGQAIGAEVNAVLFFEFIGDVVDDSEIEVLVVSNTSGERLETYVIEGEQGSGTIQMNGA